MGRKAIDITGQKFGHLTAIERVGTNSDGKATWKCVCDCGNECVAIGKELRNGERKTCGCKSFPTAKKPISKAGNKKKRLKSIWRCMQTRCYNKNHKSYKNYGNRGIKICDEWLGENGLDNFREWAMKNGYENDLTIDRIDVNGDYEPNNCRWVDYTEQNNNRRSCITLLYNGEEVTIKELSEIIGTSTTTIFKAYKQDGRIDFTYWKPSK